MSPLSFPPMHEPSSVSTFAFVILVVAVLVALVFGGLMFGAPL